MADTDYGEAVLNAFGPFVREDLKRRMPSRPDEDAEAALDMIAPEVTLQIADAWVTALSSAIEAAGGTLDTSKLDLSMLPMGLSDEELIAPDGDQEEADEIRGLLARYKASLPPGARLPEWLMRMLINGGVAVV